MPTPHAPRRLALAACGAAALLAAGARAAELPSRPLAPLTGLQPPAPPPDRYGAIVQDKASLVALGKALFWDEGVGSGGDQACASCHFHAGADPRATNALGPGLNVQPSLDPTFGSANAHLTGGGAPAGPNYALRPGDFPFHRLADPADRDSPVAYDTNDVASSAGVFESGFISPLGAFTLRGRRVDQCSQALSDVFHLGAGATALDTRKVEPRNTPTTINTAFMRRNFWDGRASNHFNGVDPFGAASVASDPTARILVVQGGVPAPQPLDLPNMSAASQAVGPPRSGFEMACAGRTFADIGRRLFLRQPLAGQTVAAGDGVLGRVRSATGKGLAVGYDKLVAQAFRPAYWQAAGSWKRNPDGTLARAAGPKDGYSQAALNFSLFFGLAIDAYERTLVSDQSPFDKGALGPDERAGLALFQGKARCAACHDGPLFSKAATFQGDPALDGTVETMAMGDGGTATYDDGFYNIGVRPAFEDLGIGGPDRFGGPLSAARRAGGGRVAVDGAFKVPSLRNVALTPPYFHNGGQKSLAEVVAFYDRGGDRAPAGGGDTTGTGRDGRLGQGAPVGPGMGGSNLAPDVGDPSRPKGGLGLSAQEQAQLVRFLQALTDPRVACHQAPFDHPSLTLSVGHVPLDANRDGNADDVLRRLPETGAGGYAGCDPGRLNGGDLFANKAADSLLSASPAR